MKKEEMRLIPYCMYRKYIIIILCLFCGYIGQTQKSFSLDEAISYAVENSCEMAVAALDIKAADAEIDEFKSIGLPQVNGRIDYNYYFYSPINPVEDFVTPAVFNVLVQEFPNEVMPPTTGPETFEFSFFTRNNLSANVDATMLLFDGSYLVGLQAANVFKELSIKKTAIKEEEIRAAVTKAYMNILISEENEKTIDKNIENITKSYDEVNAFYESGFMERLDVDRIRLSLELVKAEKEKIKDFKNITYDLLKFQMNYPLDEELTISENLDDLVNKFNTEVNDNYAEIDYNKKAQYAEILKGQELNELNIKRLKKGYLPSVLARAGVSEQLQRDNLFDSSESGFLPTVYAGLAINVPIYDGNLKKSQIQQAEIEFEKTNLLKGEFERSVKLQVKSAYSNFLIARKNLESRKRTLEIIEGIYDKTLVKFKEGVGSSIEVTQAETQLFDAQALHVNAIYDLLNSKTDLDIALGKL